MSVYQVSDERLQDYWSSGFMIPTHAQMDIQTLIFEIFPTSHFRNTFILNYFHREADDPNELSLFETLRETIYSEVATLISQNENRPHYLIELFRELQLLTTDYLRQRVLYDIKDVVSKYLVDETTDSVSAVSQEKMLFNVLF